MKKDKFQISCMMKFVRLKSTQVAQLKMILLNIEARSNHSKTLKILPESFLVEVILLFFKI